MSDRQRRTRQRGTQRLGLGLLLGALCALVFVTLGSPGVSNTGLMSVLATDDAPPTTTTSTPSPLEAPTGTCLTWTEADASDAKHVSCQEPHLFEVTGTIDLAAEFAPTAAFPSESVWRDLVQQRCTDMANQYLHGRFDPHGRFSVGAIKPTRASWQEDDRELRCGLQTVARSGALYASVGRAEQQDQSDVHEPGVCLGNDGRGIGDPVPCEQPHAVEIVAVVDLRQHFPDGFPDEATQDEFLNEECHRLTAEYAGGPDVAREKGLTVYWETLREASWNAGSHRVNCRLGAFLPDRSGFAPVTGSVRGEVTVGTQPAPPLPTTEGPAPTTGPSGSASSGAAPSGSAGPSGSTAPSGTGSSETPGSSTPPS